MWKKLRIALLLLILATVAVNHWRSQSQSRNWNSTLQIAIFPINGDGSDAAQQRISALNEDDFKNIEDFLTEQAQAHGLSNSRPVRVSLQTALKDRPPPAPAQRSGLEVLLWSLKLRYWAWQQPDGVPRANIRAFVVYWDSDAQGGRVPDSHGLAKGQIAISNVHSARSMQGSNNVVIAHEILHTMGATDKYDNTLHPVFPQGFAEPGAMPRYPQRLCEIMAGRIPLSSDELEMPRALAQCLIGPETAGEIGLKQ